MSPNLAAIGYLIAAVCFVLALRGLSSPATSRVGNRYGMAGMAIAIVVTLLALHGAGPLNYVLILIGIAIGGSSGYVTAKRIAMTAMPQLVAAFHSLVGLAAVFVACGAFLSPVAFGITYPNGRIHGVSLFEMGLGIIIGAITFSGSVIAFGKLQAKLPPAVESSLGPLRPIVASAMSSRPIILPNRHAINIALAAAVVVLLIVFIASQNELVFLVMTLLAFALCFLLIIPIGGADMPVVVSMLNSYSGWAAAGIGFTLNNAMLIIAGSLVGSSGAILSYIMCKAMNRSFFNVILGGFGAAPGTAVAGAAEARPVKSGSADDAAFILGNAESVIIVPGYGLAVARAQHAVKELAQRLHEKGV